MAEQTPDILSTIIEITAEEAGLDVAQVTPGSRLTEDLDLESLDRMVVATQVEERLDVSLDDSAVLALSTVGDLVELVTRAKA